MSRTTTQEPWSAFIITMLLSSAKDLTAYHSSLNILEYFKSEDGISKTSFSTWLKKSSRKACPLGGCQVDLGVKADVY